MTVRKTATGKMSVKGSKLKKETIRDLTPKHQGTIVKGGDRTPRADEHELLADYASHISPRPCPRL